MNVSSTVPSSFDDLPIQDIYALIITFFQSNLVQPLVCAVVSIVSFLDIITTKADPQRHISQLMSTLIDPQFYIGLFNAIKAYIEAHPWLTAFFIIGIIILFNPLALVGFGALGPIAGKFMIFSSVHFTESLI